MSIYLTREYENGVGGSVVYDHRGVSVQVFLVSFPVSLQEQEARHLHGPAYNTTHILTYQQSSLNQLAAISATGHL